MTRKDSQDSELELTALARLGLAVQVPADDPGPNPGEPLLDWLVRLGRIKPHQALAVKGLVQRGAVNCPCGTRSLAPDSGDAFRCTACGAALVKQTAGWTSKKARKIPGVGDRVGALELIEVLGKGAYGTVYRARHSQVGRLSAVKILGSSALDPRTRKRFEREVEALARLRHPGIVSVHAAFEHEGTLVCEMDLVAGEDLEQRVRRAGPLPWREAVRLCRVIASAVDHAHEQGVVHRDLKPANILIRESDQAPLVADFGLARLADQESSLTRVGAYVGTPVYMAPECFAGQASPASDVYAIGAILAFLVTGRDPFDEPSPHALLAKIAAGLCERIEVEGAPPGLERVRARAMQVDRTRRYKSAAHLGDDLARLLAGESIEGEPVRPRVKIAVGLGLALFAVVAGAGLARFTRRPRPTPSATPTPVFASAEDALEALARGERDVAVRAAAVKTLSLNGRGVTLAAIDSAVLRSPSDPDIRRLRAVQARHGGQPIDAQDLASVASSSEGTVVESVAIDALGVGVKGGLAPAVTLIEGARLRHPASRALGTLYALAASAAGDPSRRATVAEVLASVRPTDELARRLARALQNAYTFAVAIEARDAAKATTASQSVIQDLGPLAKDNPGAVGFVLAPVVAAARRAWARGQLQDLTHAEMNLALLAVSRPFLEALPPSLRCLVGVFEDLDPRLRESVDYPILCDARALTKASLEILDEDPALGSSALELAVSNSVATTPDPEALILAEEKARVACERALALPDGLDGPTHFWLMAVHRRCYSSHGELEEHLAAALPAGSDEAKAHLERALELTRTMLGISVQEFPGLVDRDSARVVRLLWQLGRHEEAVRACYDEGPGRDALAAEARREAGDLPGALELARSAYEHSLAARSRAGRTDACGAYALALADSGDVAGAERILPDLLKAEKDNGATLPELASGRVSSHVQSKRPK